MAKTAKNETTEVATTEDGGFPTSVPEYMNPTSSRGQENVGTDDVTIPRLDVIQDLSPQHKKNKPEYIEGAEVGMLFNSVTKALYGNQVFFVPVFFRKEWVIWKDRDSGGGFAGAFSSENEAKEALAALDNPEQHDIIDTAQQFGIVIDADGSHEDIVISMSRSKMKSSRQLNTMCKIAGGDRFSRVYKIATSEEQNAQGQDYWGMSISQLGYVPEEIYKHAERMYDSIASGERDVNRNADGANANANAPADGEKERY